MTQQRMILGKGVGEADHLNAGWQAVERETSRAKWPFTIAIAGRRS